MIIYLSKKEIYQTAKSNGTIRDGDICFINDSSEIIFHRTNRDSIWKTPDFPEALSYISPIDDKNLLNAFKNQIIDFSLADHMQSALSFIINSIPKEISLNLTGDTFTNGYNSLLVLNSAAKEGDNYYNNFLLFGGNGNVYTCASASPNLSSLKNKLERLAFASEFKNYVPFEGSSVNIPGSVITSLVDSLAYDLNGSKFIQQKDSILYFSDSEEPKEDYWLKFGKYTDKSKYTTIANDLTVEGGITCEDITIGGYSLTSSKLIGYDSITSLISASNSTITLNGTVAVNGTLSTTSHAVVGGALTVFSNLECLGLFEIYLLYIDGKVLNSSKLSYYDSILNYITSESSYYSLNGDTKATGDFSVSGQLACDDIKGKNITLGSQVLTERTISEIYNTIENIDPKKLIDYIVKENGLITMDSDTTILGCLSTTSHVVIGGAASIFSNLDCNGKTTTYALDVKGSATIGDVLIQDATSSTGELSSSSTVKTVIGKGSIGLVLNSNNYFVIGVDSGALCLKMVKNGNVVLEY